MFGRSLGTGLRGRRVAQTLIARAAYGGRGPSLSLRDSVLVSTYVCAVSSHAGTEAMQGGPSYLAWRTRELTRDGHPHAALLALISEAQA